MILRILGGSTGETRTLSLLGSLDLGGLTMILLTVSGRIMKIVTIPTGEMDFESEVATFPFNFRAVYASMGSRALYKFRETYFF